jgi:hypothetical protein
MSSEGSQPGDSYNTVWPDWENDRFNYTRTKNPSVRTSRAKFQGGGLPDDYQDFLGYSETAPENRRPDSEWQYGNPRQYDHYGMWDALGKPKNFDEALTNYPQWQPDEYDGMYHGFSTNPNTGVWLKPHIPGENKPGDTGWMEYKDFMLSNDSKWGGKNQNLVYDPDLQRMRYVEREKTGGDVKQVKIKSLPKAQKLGQPNVWHFYDNPAPAVEQKNLVGDVRKVKVQPAVAESTRTSNTAKTPDSWKGRTVKDIKAEADAQAAYDALPEELKRRDTLTADKRSDAEKFARRTWTAVSQPMETIAALNKGYDIPSGYLGMHNAYEGYGVGSPMTSVVDMAAGIPGFIGNAAYRQGEQLVDNPLGYLATNTLGLLDPKYRGQAISNYLDLAAVVPMASAASPLLRSAAKATSRVSKPSLLTQASRSNPANYEDDLFRYLVDSEASSGVDRNYLMSLPDDVYGRQQVIGADLRNPNYSVDQDLLRGWLAEDARINNRIMPPPAEITFDGANFIDTYTNPFAAQNIIESTSTSLLDRLMGRLPGFRRSSTQGSIDLRRPRDFVSTWDVPELPKNRSQFTKEQAKDFLKDKGELDKLEKLDDQDFRNILLTPDGKIKLVTDQKPGKSEMFSMETDEYVKDFNDNIDLLNNIIRRNNESGRDYMVTSLEKINNQKGLLHFRTPEGRVSTMNVGITPGRFRGNVKDIADEYYMTNSVPGLQMEGASPIFGVAVPKTRTYQSLNEFLKTLDMGRIKSGMNIQSEFSKGLWEDAVKKGNAFGYYRSPRIVHGIMKKEGGTKKKKPGFQVLTDANGKYVFVKT